MLSLVKDDFIYITTSNNTIDYVSAFDIFDGSFVSRFSAIDADDYDITLADTSSKLDNYNITTTEHSLSISPMAISFDWNYDNDYVYNQSAYSVSVSFTNLCTREDTLTVDTAAPYYSNNSEIDAGTYIATLDSVTNSNYYVDVNNNSLEWEISPRVLDIIWDNPLLIFNATHQQRSASATNLLGLDTISFYV